MKYYVYKYIFSNIIVIKIIFLWIFFFKNERVSRQIYLIHRQNLRKRQGEFIIELMNFKKIGNESYPILFTIPQRNFAKNSRKNR